MSKRNKTWKETRLLPFGEAAPVEVEVEFQYVDVGIGSYEFWGARGNDVQWAVEFVSAKTVSGGTPVEIEDEELIRKWEEEATVPCDDEDDSPPDDPEDME